MRWSNTYDCAGAFLFWTLIQKLRLVWTKLYIIIHRRYLSARNPWNHRTNNDDTNWRITPQCCVRFRVFLNKTGSCFHPLIYLTQKSKQTQTTCNYLREMLCKKTKKTTTTTTENWENSLAVECSVECVLGSKEEPKGISPETHYQSSTKRSQSKTDPQNLSGFSKHLKLLKIENERKVFFLSTVCATVINFHLVSMDEMEFLKWKDFLCFGLFMPKYQTFAHVSLQFLFVLPFRQKFLCTFQGMIVSRVAGENICIQTHAVNRKTSAWSWVELSCNNVTNNRPPNYRLMNRDKSLSGFAVALFRGEVMSLNLFIWIWNEVMFRCDLIII